MIKTGQVYRVKADGSVFIISHICKCKNPYGLIFNDGDVWDFCPEKLITEQAELIAEYPTWQEAVNSKEFRDDER